VLLKARLWLAGLLALALVGCLSAGAGRRRDYWPTRGWRESEPSAQGLNPQVLQGLEAFIPGSLPRTSSLLVVRHGHIVYERYFQGDPDTPRTLWSVTKSVLSTLIGIAIGEGRIRSIDRRCWTSSRVRGRPLNRRCAGSPCATCDHVRGISGSLDFLLTEDKLSVPLQAEADFYYNSMSPQVLSIILTRTTGLKARDFAMKRLFQPLGIPEVRWFQVDGYSLGAFGLELTTRDLAKIGYLLLNEGRWDGRQIVPAAWVARPPARTSGTRSRRSPPDGPLFRPVWLLLVGSPAPDSPAYMAQGWGSSLYRSRAGPGGGDHRE
jgi:CubicO group peptidase (beta-lactamase class C family)